MANLRGPIRKTSRRWQRSRVNLLVLAGVPLLLMHVALLVERALRQEMMDGLVLTRWVLSIGLLFLLRRFETRELSFKSPTAAIATVLIFALIHLPIAAPEPALPLAATGLGLALALVILDHQGAVQALVLPLIRLARSVSRAGSLGLSQERLKDRAPPAFA